MILVKFLGLYIIFSFIAPSCVYAIQEHLGIEGLIAHELAHILLLFAMCDFAYRVLRAHLFDKKEKRCFLSGAVLFALWNIWAFVAHLLHPANIINIKFKWLIPLITSDHILLVPSIICFYFASNALVKNRLDNDPRLMYDRDKD